MAECNDQQSSAEEANTRDWCETCVCWMKTDYERHRGRCRRYPASQDKWFCDWCYEYRPDHEKRRQLKDQGK